MPHFSASTSVSATFLRLRHRLRLHLHVVALFSVMPELSLVISNLHKQQQQHSLPIPSAASAATSFSLLRSASSPSVGQLLELCASAASDDDRRRLMLAVSERLATVSAAEEEIDGTVIRVVERFLEALSETDLETKGTKRRRRRRQVPENMDLMEAGRGVAAVEDTSGNGGEGACSSSGTSISSRGDDEEDSITRAAAAAQQRRQLWWPSRESMDAAYLAFNQATPYLRFAHFTANQVMLEAMEKRLRSAAARAPAAPTLMELHVVDVGGEAAQGVQWPPLMQAIASAAAAASYTAAGVYCGLRLSSLGGGGGGEMGRRLADFAASLGVPFRFFASSTLAGLLNHLESSSTVENASFSLRSHEQQPPPPPQLVVLNCIYPPEEDSVAAAAAIRSAVRPDIITLAGLHISDPSLSEWSSAATRPRLHCGGGGGALADPAAPPPPLDFSASLHHFSCIFRCLDSTLPPSSAHRLAIENTLLKRHIFDYVFSYRYRRLNYGRSEIGKQVFWTHETLLCAIMEADMKEQEADEEEEEGDGEADDGKEEERRRRRRRPLALSSVAVAQAKLLLRLHYPLEGYRLDQRESNALLLGWQQTPLFAFSAWHYY